MSLDEYCLYDGEPPHVNTDTSREAARRIKHESANMRGEILELISELRGLTCDEVEKYLELKHQTASARIRELKLMGFIRDSGERRLTRSKRRAIVWRIV